MVEPVNHFVTSATRIATLYACHEHFLLLLRGKKSGTAFGTKLQKLVSPKRKLSREFILYLMGALWALLVWLTNEQSSRALNAFHFSKKEKIFPKKGAFHHGFRPIFPIFPSEPLYIFP